MARNVRIVFYQPELDFLLKGPGGAVHKHITKCTFKGEKWARTYAPVGKTKNLKNTIRREVTTGATGVRGRIISPARYSYWVHEGTKPHVIKARRKQALRFNVNGGPMVFRKQVQHPGTSPNPFLTKALVRAVE